MIPDIVTKLASKLSPKLRKRGFQKMTHRETKALDEIGFKSKEGIRIFVAEDCENGYPAVTVEGFVGPSRCSVRKYCFSTMVATAAHVLERVDNLLELNV